MGGVTNLLQAFGLSTAGGLNAYVPLLVIGLLARETNLIHLHEPYDVLTHPLVLLVLLVLAVVDFVADKVPGVDHAMHILGLVIHPIAGAIVFLAASGDTGSVHPALAAVCGLLLAGGTHLTRSAVRPVSTAVTAGVGNPFVSFAEDVVALVLSLLAILVPVVGAVLVVLMLLMLVWLWRRRRRRRVRAAPDLVVGPG